MRKKSTIHDASEKNWIPHAHTRFDNWSVELLKALLFGINGMDFNKYVVDALIRKGSKQEKVVLLLGFLEFMIGVNRVTSLFGHMRHFPTLIDMLKNQVQEHGGQHVNLDAAIDFTEKGLHILVNKGDDQVSVQHWYSQSEHAIRTEMRLKDQSGAIIPFEDLKDDNNMGDGGCEVCSENCFGRIPMQALGTFTHQGMLRGGLCANPFTYPPGSNNSASYQASASASASTLSGAKSASSTVATCIPSASVNRQRTFDKARWTSQMCLEPKETAAVDGAGSAEGSLGIAASVVDDPMAGGDVDDSQVR